MKKLLTICTVLALLCCFAGDTFAANIIIKNPRIRKKNPRIVNEANDKDCDNKIDIDEMTITTTTETSSKAANYTDFAFEFGLATKKATTVSSVSMDITITDCSLKSITTTIVCKLNAAGNYAGSYRTTSSAECPQSLTSADITVKNPCDEISFFEVDLSEKGGKVKDKDSCNTNYKLKELTFMTENVSGFYTMNFSFAFDGRDIPDAVAMHVQLTDCKGIKTILKVKLSYNAATGVAIGSTGILQNKDCPWELTYAEVYGTNPCGEQTTWASDFGTVKTDGAGTRSTTTTTKSGRPSLQ